MSRQIAGKRLNATDYYATPPWCYENLNIDWSLFSSAHEPCRGDGRIHFFLEEECGLTCSWSEINEGKDFFEFTNQVDLILTNPPFSVAREFIDHALSISNTCIMLLRLNFLGSIDRHNWWKQKPPSALHILSKRPSFTGKGTDATEYAWFVWDKTNRLSPGVFFVDLPSKQQTQIAKELAVEQYG